MEQWTKVVPGHLGSILTIAPLGECDVLRASLSSLWATNECYFMNTAQKPLACVSVAYQTYCILTLAAAKRFSQYFLCLCDCACIGCEWCHDTVYFSWWRQGSECDVRVHVALGNRRNSVHRSWAMWDSFTMSLWCGNSMKFTSNVCPLLFTTFWKCLFTLGPYSWTIFLSLVFRLYR